MDEGEELVTDEERTMQVRTRVGLGVGVIAGLVVGASLTRSERCRPGGVALALTLTLTLALTLTLTLSRPASPRRVEQAGDDARSWLALSLNPNPIPKP